MTPSISRYLRSPARAGWAPAPMALFAASISLASFLFVASSLVTLFFVELVGAEPRLEDTDAGAADTVALRIGLLVVLVRQLLLVLGIWALYRALAPRGTTFPLAKQRWWPMQPRVALWAVGIYVCVIIYGLAATYSGIDWLIPRSTVGDEVTRDPMTLVLAALLAVVIAPLSEELLFRGVLFSALSRFGVVFGAVLSGFLFAAPHFDTGSLLPFTLVGAALAFIFFRERSLAAAVHAHALFNTISLVLLVTTT